MSRSHKRADVFECPHCGADVPVGAKVCRECGSDAGTGWQSSEEVDYRSTEVPQGYGPDDENTVSERRSPWMVVVAIVVVIALLCWVALSGLITFGG